MDYKILTEQIFAEAKESFDDIEIFLVINNEKKISYDNGKLDSYTVAESGGLSLTVYKGNRVGTAYTENLTEAAIPELLETAKATLEVNDTDETGLPQLHADQELVDIQLSETITFDAGVWLNLFKEISESGMAMSDEVHRMVSFGEQNTVYKLIMNSRGLEKKSSYQYNVGGAYAILKRGTEMQSGEEYIFFKDPDELDTGAIALAAIEKAARNFGASSITSAKMRIVLQNEVMSELLGAFESSFSAENINRSMSFLQNKKGTRVASETVNLLSDPLSDQSPVKVYFDDEGVKTKTLPLISDGVLKNYLYTLSSSGRDGVETSGNAGRSYKSRSKAKAFNLTLLPGDLSLRQLIEKADNALLITNVQGLHSGLSPISGDFSLPANGFMIENGKIGRAVNQITIAGNFCELMSNVEAIANDMKVNLNGCLSSSVLVSSLNVSGEKE